MPVDGYNHKRVWQYNFLPQPVTLLDRDCDRYDFEYERNVIANIRRGKAAPRSVYLNELITDNYPVNNSLGWELAVQHCKNAIRTNAVFMNDENIAKKSITTKALKEAHTEKIEEDRKRWEEQRPIREAEKAAKEARQAEMDAERKRTYEEYKQKMAEYKEFERKRAEEWEEAARHAEAARQEQARRMTVAAKWAAAREHLQSNTKKLWDDYVADMEKKKNDKL